MAQLVVFALLAFVAVEVAARSRVVTQYHGGRLDTSVSIDGPWRVWVEMDADALLNLPPGAPTEGWEESWTIPSHRKSPLNHVFTSYSPVLHIRLQMPTLTLLAGRPSRR